MKHKLIAFTLLGFLGQLNPWLAPTARAAAPAATTVAATGVTATNATLNGTLNPNGAATTTYFAYGLTTNYGYVGAFTVMPATNTTQTLPGWVVALPGAAGANWTSNADQGWYALASSADGLRLAAAVAGNGIWISTNNGAAWTLSSAPVGYWNTIASSADGTRLAAAQYAIAGKIWTSTNSGGTWTQSSAPAGAWNSIVSSADGTHLAATLDYGNIFTSTNAGATWTPTSAPTDRWYLASSAGGTRLFAAATRVGGGIWASTDGGVTWIPTSAPTSDTTNYTYWTGITASADGTRLAAVEFNGGKIWTSTNSGLTWIQASAPSKSWSAIASSADGVRLAATVFYSGGIWNSTNGGVTWAQNGAPGKDWTGITSSADGSRLAAVVHNGAVWTSTGTVGQLLSGTTYHYRLVGFNSFGDSLGGDLTFTTVSIQPLNFKLNGSMQLAGGTYQLNFTNLGGLSFTVLTTTNLALPAGSWTVLGAAVETLPGQYQFTDPQATNRLYRYYRVRTP